MGRMDSEQEYIDSIAPGHRSLFDRVSGLILEEFPQASMALPYGMPTYRVEKRRLHIGVWSHGVSIYGWGADGDGDFSSGRPTLTSGKATIRLQYLRQVLMAPYGRSTTITVAVVTGVVIASVCPHRAEQPAALSITRLPGRGSPFRRQACAPVAHLLSASRLANWATFLSTGWLVYWWISHLSLIRGLPALT